MSFKSKCEEIDHYSGNGKVFLSDGDEVVFHATSDFDVLNYGVNSNVDLFLEEEVMIALGGYTTREQALSALSEVLHTIEGMTDKQWAADAKDLEPKPRKKKLEKRITKLGRRPDRPPLSGPVGMLV